MITQTEIIIPAYERGYHLITHIVLKQIPSLPQTGIFHLFIKHTSAGLTINENADPSVRNDFESIFNKIVPENLPFLTHTMEGADDMPAHIKSALTQTQLSIPIRNNDLNMGIWQGIYIFEHRAHAHKRTLSLHILGE